MKTSPYFLMIVNALLAIELTVLSFQYVQPKNCYSLCDGSRTCPNGACAAREQKAGWPIPVFVDDPGGGSPTGGWGVLGPEDPPLGIPMIQNVLFYSLLVWIVLFIIQFLRYQALPLKPFLMSLPLNALLAVTLWFFYYVFAYFLGFNLFG